MADDNYCCQYRFEALENKKFELMLWENSGHGVLVDLPGGFGGFLFGLESF